MSIDFNKMNGLVPAIIQHYISNQVLMLGFMNAEALQETQKTGRVTFYSRTKNRLWTKGEESGNFLEVKEIQEDCDKDTLLIKVDPVGPVCHTGEISCFSGDSVNPYAFLEQLQELLRSRKQEMPEGSYTAELFKSGTNKIAQKVGEEAVEFIIESKEKDDDKFLNEGADLLFHVLILLIDRGYALSDIAAILKGRH
jgi:phosphoribosyl-ATP pyrophosphohydrolase/phosphoribosyl-AMP cyclohydrolase